MDWLWTHKTWNFYGFFRTPFGYIWEVDREVNQPFIDYCSTAIINMPYFDGFYHKKMVNLGMVWRLFPVMVVGQENPHEYSRAASIMDHSYWSFFAPKNYRLGPHFIVLLLDIWTYLDCAAAHLLAPVFSVLWSQVIDGKVTRVQSSRILFEPPVFSGPFFHPVLMPPVMFVGL